jgi:hypothetical protein
MVINQLIEGVVSAKRLATYLSGDELQSDARQVTLNPVLCAGDVVCLDTSDVINVCNRVLGFRYQGWRIFLV